MKFDADILGWQIVPVYEDGNDLVGSIESIVEYVCLTDGWMDGWIERTDGKMDG